MSHLVPWVPMVTMVASSVTRTLASVPDGWVDVS
jgi:hypothetical protein